ncbi:MAG: hypothetical protein GXP22_00645 [Gammaproteobacteria bacterium]|nr:hypothetical protein [Gammaproteobacteria bacterium]
MAHDYKNRARNKKSKKPISGWLWLVAVILIALFSTLLLYLQEQKQAPAIQKKPTADSSKKKSSSNKQSNKSRFDFYELLPEESFDLFKPDSNQADQKSSSQYLLQAGSFKTYAQADKLKAQLAFSGIVTTINTATTADGKTWHRVQAGPYNNQLDIDQTQQKLQAMKIEPILLRIKK